jgi:hypothetical protein
MEQGDQMTHKRNRKTKPVEQAPAPTVADRLKAVFGWKPSLRTFHTSANRECGGCHGIKPGSEFDVPHHTGPSRPQPVPGVLGLRETQVNCVCLAWRDRKHFGLSSVAAAQPRFRTFEETNIPLVWLQLCQLRTTKHVHPEENMTPLKIPPCPTRGSDGSNWPKHRAKARNKTYTSRLMAALEAERRAADALRIIW